VKVKELIAKLGIIDPEYDIIISSDMEGNNFSPLYELSEGMYIPNNDYSGDLYEEEYTDEEEYKPNCVVLFPTN
jgi:hypothetical protein